MKELFERDFRYLNASAEIVVGESTEAPASVRMTAHLDFHANGAFFSCFIPERDSPGPLIRDAWRNKMLLVSVRTMAIKHRYENVPPETSSENLSFTGRVWIYYDGILDDDLADVLRQEASDEGISLAIRDHRYAEARAVMKTPIAFLSHDSADKKTIAIPLVRALRHEGVSVWLDQEQIKPGDSLRQRIDEGIRDAKRFIMLLSPSFLENRRWAESEYSSIFALEKARKTSLIIPVWCGVTEKEIAEHCPLLLDRLAIIWNGDVKEVASKLAQVLLPP